MIVVIDPQKQPIMRSNKLIDIAKTIVFEAKELKDKYLGDMNLAVNYACIFSHNSEEFKNLNIEASKIGIVIDDTPTGYLYKIKKIKTIAGDLQLLKIRKPDPTRPEKGDADFTVPDFQKFKRSYNDKLGFKLIQREKFVMIELKDSNYDVRVYFSNPPLDKQLGLK